MQRADDVDILRQRPDSDLDALLGRAGSSSISSSNICMLAHLHTVSVYIFATNRQHNFEKMITIHVTIQGGYVRYYRHANILYIKPFSAVHQHFCFFSHISDTVTNQHAAVSCSDSRFFCVCVLFFALIFHRIRPSCL